MTTTPSTICATDERWLHQALDAGATARLVSPPNPWVGAVLVDPSGIEIGRGATEAVGGRHAEIVALDDARRRGDAVAGATMYVTLEPCGHTGRTGPCTRAIIDAGIARVVIGVVDPDPQVAGDGIDQLRGAGVTVDTAGGLGLDVAPVIDQLAAYLHHRRTGRPFVVAKVAATLDGATAAADGSSQWITGLEARNDAHRLRAESDAILVGAGTVRTDNPRLTVRDVDGATDPLRIVLGDAPADAAVHPCRQWRRSEGDLGDLLDMLGAEDVLQLMVEGGATVLGAFHRQHLIDRYDLYLAPAFAGGRPATPLFGGAAARTVDDLWRGRIISTTQLGTDIRIRICPEETTS